LPLGIVPHFRRSLSKGFSQPIGGDSINESGLLTARVYRRGCGGSNEFSVTLGGNVSETLTVTKTAAGYAIKAELVVPPPEGTPQAGPGADIVLDGDKFSYKRTMTTPEGRW
jgi:hypothetical protein